MNYNFFLRFRERRRCLFLKDKIKIKRLVRTVCSIKGKMENHRDKYTQKTIQEIIRGNDFVGVFSDHENLVRILNEVLILILYPETNLQFKKIKLFLLTRLLDLLIERILIPILIHLLIEYFKKN